MWITAERKELVPFDERSFFSMLLLSVRVLRSMYDFRVKDLPIPTTGILISLLRVMVVFAKLSARVSVPSEAILTSIQRLSFEDFPVKKKKWQNPT